MNRTGICLTALALIILLAGCGGDTVSTDSGGSSGGSSGGNTGGTGGSGATVTRSGDGVFTGGGTTEASGIKIVGPNIKFPANFTFMGGKIEITATVTSQEKMDYVKAVIALTGETAKDYPMIGSSSYKCTYDIKPNLQASKTAVYTIKLVAANQAGKSAQTATGTLEVSPQTTKPPDPPF